MSTFRNATGVTSTQRIARAAALGVAMLIGGGVSAQLAQAAYTVTLEQMGSNVVATGSGAIDLTGMSPLAPGFGGPGLAPNVGDVATGPTALTSVNLYTGFSGPTSFGPGSGAVPDSGTGDAVGIFGDVSVDLLIVPSNYVSDTALSSTSTFDNATIASLGATPGTYKWTWGTGANADSFTLNIEAVAMPEPSSLTVLVIGLACLGMVVRTRRT